MNIFSGLYSYWKSGITTSTSLPEAGWSNKVLTQLLNQEISAQEIITLLSENPKLKMCYAKSAGVVEGYTVGQHTQMVLENAQRYREYFKPLVCDHVQWGEFLLFLALHDIGKGISKDPKCISLYGNMSAKELELQMNRVILVETLEQLRVKSRIGYIFQAMLMYDSQGDYLKGDLDANDFKKHLLNMSGISGLIPCQFYQLYNIFHVVDAASYPNLQPLFIFNGDSLRHCEGNQLMVDYFIELIKSECS